MVRFSTIVPVTPKEGQPLSFLLRGHRGRGRSPHDPATVDELEEDPVVRGIRVHRPARGQEGRPGRGLVGVDGGGHAR